MSEDEDEKIQYWKEQYDKLEPRLRVPGEILLVEIWVRGNDSVVFYFIRDHKPVACLVTCLLPGDEGVELFLFEELTEAEMKETQKFADAALQSLWQYKPDEDADTSHYIRLAQIK